LTAVGDGPEPGAAMDCEAYIVAVEEVNLAGVESDPDAERRAYGPRLTVKCALDLTSGGKGVSGMDEDREDAVAFTTTANQNAVMVFDLLGQERVMAGQREAVRLLLGFEQLGAPFNIS
jgi:hypothetical protein